MFNNPNRPPRENPQPMPKWMRRGAERQELREKLQPIAFAELMRAAIYKHIISDDDIDITINATERYIDKVLPPIDPPYKEENNG